MMFRKMKCINGRLANTAKHKPAKAGHVKTEAYIDNRRRLNARCFRGSLSRSRKRKLCIPDSKVTEFKSDSISQ